MTANMYWMPKMRKNPIKDSLIIASPKLSIKPLEGTITLMFHLFLRQIQIIIINVDFLHG